MERTCVHSTDLFIRAFIFRSDQYYATGLAVVLSKDKQRRYDIITMSKNSLKLLNMLTYIVTHLDVFFAYLQK